MSSNSVCNHTRDEKNRTPATRSSDFVNHSYDYRPNWTPLSPITIMNNSTDCEIVLSFISMNAALNRKLGPGQRGNVWRLNNIKHCLVAKKVEVSGQSVKTYLI